MVDNHNLTDLINSTALMSCEEPLLLLHRDQSRSGSFSRRSLVGRFISQRTCSIAAIKNNALRVWHLKGDLRVQSLPGKNMFLFNFFEEEDKVRILLNSPWFLMQSHLVLRSWDSLKSPQEVQIDSTVAWVRVLGLTPDLRGDENINLIASLFKGLIGIDEEGRQADEWSSFLRLQLELFIDKPLPTGFQCPDDHGGLQSIEFIYETLPDFCYCCGVMGHTISYCELRATNSEFFQSHQTRYGSHMRIEVARNADSNRQARKLPSGNYSREKSQAAESSSTSSPKAVDSQAVGNQTDVHDTPMFPSSLGNSPALQLSSALHPVQDISDANNYTADGVLSFAPGSIPSIPFRLATAELFAPFWIGYQHPTFMNTLGFSHLSLPNNVLILRSLAQFYTGISSAEINTMPIPILVYSLLPLQNVHISNVINALHLGHPCFRPSQENPIDSALPFLKPNRVCWENLCGKEPHPALVQSVKKRRTTETLMPPSTLDDWDNEPGSYNMGLMTGQRPLRIFRKPRLLSGIHSAVADDDETTASKALVTSLLPPQSE